MSGMFMAAVAQGVSAATKDYDAQYRHLWEGTFDEVRGDAYNEAYKRETAMANVNAANYAMQQNISAVEQDRITSIKNIERKQNQAEAWAKVNAAAAGVQGGSVQDTIIDTEKNAAFATAAANKQADQQSKQYVAQIGRRGPLALERAELRDVHFEDSNDIVNGIMNVISNVSRSDIAIAEASIFGKE